MIEKAILIISNNDLSERKGPTYSRIICYCSALEAYGFNKIYISSLMMDSVNFEFQNTDLKRCIFIGKKEKKYSYAFDKVFGIFYKILRLKKIIGICKKESPELISLVYPFFGTFFEELLYIIFIKLNKIPIFSERNERKIGIVLNYDKPKRILKKSLFWMLFPFELIDAILCDFLIIFYRGNIAISVKFEKWIKRFNKKTIRIPILVNRIYVEKPSCIEKKSFKILYTGSLSNRKDSLDVLLRSIQILKEGYKRTNFFVEIYGEGKEQSKMLLQKEIETQRINDYVSYKGNLPLEEIKVRQAECDLLILLRSPNLQNSFGFSTKLAEYLSSGTMVLCTAVSDNGMFVIHGDNGFIVDKNDPQNVASAINEIMTLPFERRQMMAIKAFETVQNNFLPENYSELIGSFLLS